MNLSIARKQPHEHQKKCVQNSISFSWKYSHLILCVFLAHLFTDIQSVKANNDFHFFLESFWPKAKKAGVSRIVFDRAIGGLTPDPSINKSQTSQPEFVTPVWSYVDRAVSDLRLKEGQEALKNSADLLNQIEQKYGVEKQIFLAIWGLESSYGKNKGDKDIIRSLATMAYSGNRKKYGSQQLIAALQILQKGDVPLSEFKGSWAGAMGHTQFIPTTYNHYAVDFNGDGTRDVWRNVSDALASTANYLKRAGWETGKTWGYEVKLPPNFDYSQAGLGKKRTLAQWYKAGVTRMNGFKFPRPSDKAELILPAGAKGPKFLILKNFRVIMRYNVSISYVLAVGHLADRIIGYPEFIQPWPKQERLLKYVEQKELQILLSRKGYKISKIDGKMGSETIRAIRAFQKRNGLPADGYPDFDVLQKLRN